MNRRRWLWLGALALAAGWLVWENDPAAPSASSHPTVPVHESRATEPGLSDEWAARDAEQPAIILNDWNALVEWLRSTPPPGAEEIAARLLELREKWSELDAHVLAEAIRFLLESEEDAPTGLSFLVGDHGQLAAWPTLRVFLLDVLVGADPETASDVARGVLDQTSSANEYAVALRSLAHAGPGRAPDVELLSRFDALLKHDDWTHEAGFAEAFDLMRLVGTSEAARRIANWQGSPALRSMALHEFAADHPAAVVDLLGSADGASLDPLTRATLMARIDPADGAQLSAADAYLRGTDLSIDEAAAFLESFPLRSATTGHRLYGETPAPYSREGIAAGDRAALMQVNAWMADASLTTYRPHLAPLQKRLEDWVQQAER